MNLSETIQIVLAEPEELTNVSLVSSINGALVIADVMDFSLVADDENSISVDASSNASYRLYLSKSLARTLSCTNGFIDKHFKTSDVEFFRGNHMIIVKADVVTPQVINGSRCRALRMVEHDRSKTRVHQVLDPVYFSLLEREHISSFHLEFINESGEYINFSKGVTCVLQLKS